MNQREPSSAKNDLQLEAIIPNEKQIECLYQELIKRSERSSQNISHETMPSFEKHTAFVKQHPYRAWFLVLQAQEVIGSVYAQFDNSVGLQLSEACTATNIEAVMSLFRAHLRPLPAKPSLRFGDFFLNVAYSNKNMQQALDTLGYKATQISYVAPK